MSDGTVPDILNVDSFDCTSESFDMTEEDDVNWCTGFWNELVRENSPSLYPESPIFSSKLYDWDDPMFLDSVFICPDVEEVFAGSRLSEYPAFVDTAYEARHDEDTCSVYPAANLCDIVGPAKQTSPQIKSSKQKRKRTRKPKSENEHGTPSNRKSTGCVRKTKEKVSKSNTTV